MNSTLTILACPHLMDDNPELYLEGEFLPLTIEAIHYLKKNNIKFITLDEFIDPVKFADFVDSEFIHIEDLFKDLDGEYYKLTRYPHAFSGNIYPFYTIFSYLKYAQKIVDFIRKKEFVKVILVSPPFSDSEQKFLNLYKNIHPSRQYRDSFLVNLLIHGLNPEICISQRPDKSVSFKDSKWFSKLCTLQFEGYLNYVGRHLKKILFKHKKAISFTNILIVQTGYEIDELFVRSKRFSTIEALSLSEKESIEDAVQTGFEKIVSTHKRAAQRACGEYTNIFLHCLFQYYENEVKFIPFYLEKIQYQIKTVKPSMGLYTAGAITLKESIYAHSLMEMKIPIFYFQHSGTEVLIDNVPFRKFINGNPNIKKTVIACTDADQTVLAKCRNTQSWTGGYQKGKDIIRYYKKKHLKKNGILYLTSWYHSNQVLVVKNDDSDYLSYQKHCALFELVNKYKIPMDIKLFPSEDHAHLDYFHDLIKYTASDNIRLVGNPRAEYLIPKYSLIIIESVCSTLSSYLFAVDSPVIYYLCQDHYISGQSYDDFVSGHYMAKDKKEMKTLLSDFCQGHLPPKKSNRLIDTYLNPERITSPASYIRTKLETAD